MGFPTDIEWVRNSDGTKGASINAWIGCEEDGPGCKFCYARSMAKRMGHPEWWRGERHRTSAALWKQPFAWNRLAAKRGIRIRVFLNSMSDFFDAAVPQAWRDDVFATMRATPHLDWIIVTKRIENAARMLPEDWGGRFGTGDVDDGYEACAGLGGYPNVWLLITVCNQAEFERDYMKALAIPAKVRGLSVEPMLGPICHVGLGHFDWVICGGESGSAEARPLHPAWAVALQFLCEVMEVPFFFKQWGQWQYAGMIDYADFPKPELQRIAQCVVVERCNFHPRGKKAAGRILLGRHFEQMPLAGLQVAA